MAKLRPARCYNKLERPYTRQSRYKKKGFVPGAPHSKITIYHMGDRTREFSHRVGLFSKDPIQIRDASLETARVASNRVLSSNLGKAYHFHIKVHPHHILRENPIAKGAGADRFQKGMKQAFGKTIGSAARVKKDQEIMYVGVDENGIEKAKMALDKAGKKLPCKFKLQVKKVST